mmetsp:Transcript_18961/g.44164  ORF Transcript_18961/g.44164 Transcript_18961/m.44164 type:complete len:1065 (+) Transcript_18961:132-3326(+)
MVEAGTLTDVTEAHLKAVERVLGHQVQNLESAVAPGGDPRLRRMSSEVYEQVTLWEQRAADVAAAAKAADPKLQSRLRTQDSTRLSASQEDVSEEQSDETAADAPFRSAPLFELQADDEAGVVGTVVQNDMAEAAAEPPPAHETTSGALDSGPQLQVDPEAEENEELPVGPQEGEGQEELQVHLQEEEDEVLQHEPEVDQVEELPGAPQMTGDQYIQVEPQVHETTGIHDQSQGVEGKQLTEPQLADDQLMQAEAEPEAQGEHTVQDEHEVDKEDHEVEHQALGETKAELQQEELQHEQIKILELDKQVELAETAKEDMQDTLEGTDVVPVENDVQADKPLAEACPGKALLINSDGGGAQEEAVSGSVLNAASDETSLLASEVPDMASANVSTSNQQQQEAVDVTPNRTTAGIDDNVEPSKVTEGHEAASQSTGGEGAADLELTASAGDMRGRGVPVAVAPLDLQVAATDTKEEQLSQLQLQDERARKMKARRSRASLLRSCSWRPAASKDEEQAIRDWETAPDDLIVEEIQLVISSVDALREQSVELFNGCFSNDVLKADAVTGSPVASDYHKVPVTVLHLLTQRIIDKLGATDAEGLAHIGDIYLTVANTYPEGIGFLEFQGFLAAVLARLLHELEERLRNPKQLLCNLPSEEQEDELSQDQLHRSQPALLEPEHQAGHQQVEQENWQIAAGDRDSSSQQRQAMAKVTAPPQQLQADAGHVQGSPYTNVMTTTSVGPWQMLLQLTGLQNIGGGGPSAAEEAGEEYGVWEEDWEYEEEGPPFDGEGSMQAAAPTQAGAPSQSQSQQAVAAPANVQQLQGTSSHATAHAIFGSALTQQQRPLAAQGPPANVKPAAASENAAVTAATVPPSMKQLSASSGPMFAVARSAMPAEPLRDDPVPLTRPPGGYVVRAASAQGESITMQGPSAGTRSPFAAPSGGGGEAASDGSQEEPQPLEHLPSAPDEEVHPSLPVYVAVASRWQRQHAIISPTCLIIASSPQASPGAACASYSWLDLRKTTWRLAGERQLFLLQFQQGTLPLAFASRADLDRFVAMLPVRINWTAAP